MINSCFWTSCWHLGWGSGSLYLQYSACTYSPSCSGFEVGKWALEKKIKFRLNGQRGAVFSIDMYTTLYTILEDVKLKKYVVDFICLKIHHGMSHNIVNMAIISLLPEWQSHTIGADARYYTIMAAHLMFCTEGLRKLLAHGWEQKVEIDNDRTCCRHSSVWPLRQQDLSVCASHSWTVQAGKSTIQ